MALTDIQKLRLEIGLKGQAEELMLDDELQYFLDENGNNVKRAAIATAGALLFQLSAYLHERVGTELEIWGHSWFENYKKALEMYLRNPSNNVMVAMSKAYAGGISVSDAKANVQNPDNIIVEVDNGIPKDGEASSSSNTGHDVFKRDMALYNTSFEL